RTANSGAAPRWSAPPPPGSDSDVVVVGIQLFAGSPRPDRDGGPLRDTVKLRRDVDRPQQGEALRVVLPRREEMVGTDGDDVGASRPHRVCKQHDAVIGAV